MDLHINQDSLSELLSAVDYVIAPYLDYETLEDYPHIEELKFNRDKFLAVNELRIAGTSKVKNI